jgi:hypothetical protein
MVVEQRASGKRDIGCFMIQATRRARGDMVGECPRDGVTAYDHSYAYFSTTKWQAQPYQAMPGLTIWSSALGRCVKASRNIQHRRLELCHKVRQFSKMVLLLVIT